MRPPIHRGDARCRERSRSCRRHWCDWVHRLYWVHRLCWINRIDRVNGFHGLDRCHRCDRLYRRHGRRWPKRQDRRHAGDRSRTSEIKTLRFFGAQKAPQSASVVHCTNAVPAGYFLKTPIGFPIGVFALGCRRSRCAGAPSQRFQPPQQKTGMPIAAWLSWHVWIQQ